MNATSKKTPAPAASAERGKRGALEKGDGITISSSRDGKKQQPEWADGLRSLYDSVVDEPLPDSFQDLLAKLDEKGQ